MNNQIAPGTAVEFETDYGPKKGRVTEIKPHIGNGQSIALIDAPCTMNNSPWTVPVSDLKVAA